MMKSKWIMLVLMGGMLMTAVYIAGCGSQSAEEAGNRFTDKFSPGSMDLPEGEGQLDGVDSRTASGEMTKDEQKEAAGGPPPPPTTTGEEQIPAKIIKSADISYQVEEFEESRKVILGIVKKFSARVSSENQANDGYRITNTLVIRVEGPVFDSLVDALLTEAIYVEYKTINAQDVTEEYVDLTARLKSKKELEAQYAEILKKANSINEILEVQEYLGRIREEIESFEGRLNYMDDRVAYSTITLKFYEQLDSVSKKPDRTFNSRMEDAFGSGWSGLVAFFVGLIYLWPVWLILGFLTWLIIFLVKRGRRRRRAAKEAKEKAQG